MLAYRTQRGRLKVLREDLEPLALAQKIKADLDISNTADDNDLNDLYQKVRLLVSRSPDKFSTDGGNLVDIAKAIGIPFATFTVNACKKIDGNIILASHMMSILVLLYPYCDSVTHRIYGSRIHEIKRSASIQLERVRAGNYEMSQVEALSSIITSVDSYYRF